MTIYSWNMLFRNKRLAEALEFIRTSEADIFCLQEVPGDALPQILAIPEYHVAEAKEVNLVHRGKPGSSHLVVLSRYPIAHSKPIAMGTLAIPPIARTFYAAGLWALATSERHAIVADIQAPSGTVRVFNLHLPLQRPSTRAIEFERALIERDPAVPTVVCGDFNTLEQPHITILTPLLGGPLQHWPLWWRERTEMEARFAAHRLSNPLRGRHTHPLSRSQLDHILVSPEFAVERAEVVTERYGSDHHPIWVVARRAGQHAAPQTT